MARIIIIGNLLWCPSQIGKANKIYRWKKWKEKLFLGGRFRFVVTIRSLWYLIAAAGKSDLPPTAGAGKLSLTEIKSRDNRCCSLTKNSNSVFNCWKEMAIAGISLSCHVFLVPSSCLWGCSLGFYFLPCHSTLISVRKDASILLPAYLFGGPNKVSSFSVLVPLFKAKHLPNTPHTKRGDTSPLTVTTLILRSFLSHLSEDPCLSLAQVEPSKVSFQSAF